jgi:hypothetical protein
MCGRHGWRYRRAGWRELLAELGLAAAVVSFAQLGD